MKSFRVSRLSRFLAVAAIASMIGTGLAPTSAGAQESSSEPTDLEKVSAIVQPSIVYMETYWSGRVYQSFLGRRYYPFGKSRFFEIGPVRCSGFVVNPDGIIGTAGHCVQLEKAYTKAIARQARAAANRQGVSLAPLPLRVEGSRNRRPNRNVFVAYGAAASGLRTGQAYPALVLKLRIFDKGDVALLRTEAQDLPALEMAPEAEIDVGTEVVSVGYAASVDLVSDATFNPSFTDGAVSALRTRGSNLYQVYQISSAVSPGMSGGPTVDLQGRVIGINSFKVNPAIETQQFNFVSPAHQLDELMSDRGIENEIGDINTTYRAGLESFWSGEKEDALASFDEVLGLVPSHELAQQYRAEALRLPDSEPASASDGGFNWMLLLLLAVLVAGAGGILLLNRRRLAAAAAAHPAGSAVMQPSAQMPQSPPPAPAANGPVGRPTVERTPANKPSLEIKSGPQVGRRIEIEGTMLIGRENADVILEDSEVSRRHAIIRSVEGHLEIEDVGSTNGSMVNGSRITGPVRLHAGDSIELGGTHLEVLGLRPQGTVIKAQAAPPVLVITSGSQAGRRIEVDRQVAVGREDADIVLDEPQVSRRHAVLRPAGGFLEVEDMGSRNGTLVNGRQIDSATFLREGDVVEIGGIILEVTAGRATDTHTLPQATQ